MIGVFGSSFIFESFEEICRLFSFMAYKDDKLLVKEAVYILMKINNEMIFSLDELYNISLSNDMVEIFILLLTLYRPIRHYESVTAFLMFINKVRESYNSVIYSYLVMNILFEIVIFFLLQRYIVLKFIRINKSMNTIEKCFVL